METCLREIAEETGVPVSAKELVPVRSYVNPSSGLHRHVFCIRRYVEPSQIHLGEGQGFAWVAVEALSSLDLTAVSRSDLEYYLRTEAR